MQGWDFPVELDSSADLSIYLQIARAVAGDIQRGRLVPGDRLPGTRRLAQILGVHRNTVLAAYTELGMEGWITASQKRGTFVSHDLPEPRVPHHANPNAPGARVDGAGLHGTAPDERGGAVGLSANAASPRVEGIAFPPNAHGPRVGAPSFISAGSAVALGFDLPDEAMNPVPAICRAGSTDLGPGERRPEFVFSGGLPDVRLLPATALGRAYSRALRVSWRTSLMYGDPEGHPKLRAALATLLAATRGLPASADRVFITRGSQMGMWLASRALVAPGDVVAVEALGYRPAWEAFRLAGARLVPIEVDAHGLRVDALETLMATERVRAIYVTPHHQFPTTVMLSAERREQLLRLATAHRCAIVEEDYDHEFHYEGRPGLPLAAADRAGIVIYVGTLSKVLAPGLRVGFMVAPTALMPRLAAIRSNVDLQGDLCLEHAVADLLEDGEIQRHVARMRRVYRARRDALAEALRQTLPDALTFTPSPGGTAIWASVAEGIDVEAWSLRARAEGVSLATGRRYDFQERPVPFVRLGFASLNEQEITEATRRLARCLTARRAVAAATRT